MNDDTGRVVFSAAEESFGAAVRELQSALPRRNTPKPQATPDQHGAPMRHGAARSSVTVERLGPDLGVLPAGPTAAEVAAACRDRPVVFVRHLTVQLARIPRPDADDPERVAARIPALLDGPLPAELAELAGADEVAVQAWISDPDTVEYGSRQLFEAVAATLRESGRTVRRAGAAAVLSCAVVHDGVLIGLNRGADSLSDWPGGRVRLSRGPDQVSRAEFKLEELFQAYPVPLPERGRAVDLGAAPGGWTRILRDRGMDVWAVDPGALAGSLAADPRVHHVATTVGEFLRSNRTRFDLAVNDLRMEPHLSTRVMLDAAATLRPGAHIVLTLKTGSRRPLDTVRDCLRLLRERYQVLFARQLYHNRKEVTVLARLR
ncbi:ribosomal RNA large subunit methyltransferase M [Actinocatenispora thailandica]|uniref:Ribosomal RNA large subunit methyltransferase M n=1 Tax=Actinocatenispora thailandica TaxID=227318 RepID=A0A7R7DRD8_9ACTN|nr:SAM-dependent methyltransferase [Actinocatenispora thailandica]BCJ36341.1 ribosomal RNA large subunit methyltransferase M [Actinocatenispora thailandica]